MKLIKSEVQVLQFATFTRRLGILATLFSWASPLINFIGSVVIPSTVAIFLIKG